MSMLLAMLLLSDPMPTASPGEFATRLQTCEPASFGHPHPLMRGFRTTHTIVGLRDGACRYAQTVPGGMNMECAFSDAGRNAFVGEFEAMAAGQLRTSSGDAKVWQDECELVMPDGKRKPLSSP